MRKHLLALCVLFIATQPASAQEVAGGAPPSEDTIRELIEVTGASRLIEDTYGQVDSIMQQAMREALAGKALTTEQEALLAEMRQRIVEIFREQMSWQKMEPMIIDIYRKSFTQSELDGMLAFYRTDAGRAVIAKMPVVMQHTMEALQQDLGAMMPKLRAVQDDIIARLKATKP